MLRPVRQLVDARHKQLQMIESKQLLTEEVTGSNPVSPTNVSAGQGLVTDPEVTNRSVFAAYIGSKMGAKII